MTDIRFDRAARMLGDDMMQRLARCRVIVFGIGGVGSWCVEALARSGVGHISMVDSDSVAVSNINRQLPALSDTVGCPKVEVMRERLLQINPGIEVEAMQRMYTAETAQSFDLDSYDYVIDAIDTLDSKARLIEHALRCRCTLFSSMGAAQKLDIRQIATAPFDKVQGCPLARALRQKFKRAGGIPRRRFLCVYSPESMRAPMADTKVSTVAEGPAAELKSRSRINGSVMHTTATFGLMLCQLVIADLLQGR